MAGREKQRAGRSTEKEVGGEAATSGAGLNPATKPDQGAPISSTELGRVGDYGDQGQFAPGGYYNQREVTAPRRIDLDEYTSATVPDAADETEGPAEER